MRDICSAQPAAWLDSFGEPHKRREDAWDGNPESAPPRPLYESIDQPVQEVVKALHRDITNLPCNPPVVVQQLREWYMTGYRDARHAAAELVRAVVSEPEGDRQ